MNSVARLPNYPIQCPAARIAAVTISISTINVAPTNSCLRSNMNMTKPPVAVSLATAVPEKSCVSLSVSDARLHTAARASVSQESAAVS